MIRSKSISLFKIDPLKPAMVPQSRTAEKVLRSFESPLNYIPTAGNLLMLRSPGRSGEPDATQMMNLCGDLEKFPIMEIVSMIHSGVKSCQVMVFNGNIEQSVIFSKGAVTWALSNQPQDRLGEVLLRLGRITKEQLEEVLLSGNAGTKIGKTLIDRGYLKPHDLFTAIRFQITEIFFNLLAQPEGEFFLLDEPPKDSFPTQLRLSTQNLLMDGIRRIDELDLFRKKIPTEDSILTKKTGGDPSNLNQQEQALYALVDGKTKIVDLATMTHEGEFETLKTLFHLLEARLIEVKEQVDEEPRWGLEEGKKGLDETIRVYNLILKEVFSEVAKIGITTGFRLDVDAFFASDQHEFKDVFKGMMLTDNGSLEATRLLKNIASYPAPEQLEQISQALNELMFFELFQVGEYVDPQVEENLAKRVKTIYSFLDNDAD